jgi:hypothetical protein
MLKSFLSKKKEKKKKKILDIENSNSRSPKSDRKLKIHMRNYLAKENTQTLVLLKNFDTTS